MIDGAPRYNWCGPLTIFLALAALSCGIVLPSLGPQEMIYGALALVFAATVIVALKR